MRFRRPVDGEVTFIFSYFHKGKKPDANIKEAYGELALRELEKNVVFKPWKYPIKRSFRVTVTADVEPMLGEYFIGVTLHSDYL